MKETRTVLRRAWGSNSPFLSDVGMELYARIIELGSYFVVRLRKTDYKDERKQINSNDSPINLKLNAERLNLFNDPHLKEKYSKELWLNLRIVTIELPTGETETVLTKIPSKIMTTDDIFPNLQLHMGNRNQLQYF